VNGKKTYYVSVQSGSVLSDVDSDAFEFEIRADEQDLAKLEELFENRRDSEMATFKRSFVPGLPYHQDEENDMYDEDLREVYRLVYELGTEKSRQFIEQMGVL